MIGSWRAEVNLSLAIYTIRPLVLPLVAQPSIRTLPPPLYLTIPPPFLPVTFLYSFLAPFFTLFFAFLFPFPPTLIESF